jgi:hypothetical protein
LHFYFGNKLTTNNTVSFRGKIDHGNCNWTNERLYCRAAQQDHQSFDESDNPAAPSQKDKVERLKKIIYEMGDQYDAEGEIIPGVVDRNTELRAQLDSVVKDLVEKPIAIGATAVAGAALLAVDLLP